MDTVIMIIELTSRPTVGHTSMSLKLCVSAPVTESSVARIDSRVYIASCNALVLSLCHAPVDRPFCLVPLSACLMAIVRQSHHFTSINSTAVHEITSTLTVYCLNT